MDSLPEQPPLPNPEAERYAARALAMTRSLPPPRVEAYGPSPYQRIAIYAPGRADGPPLPIVMYMHGGGWTHGHKEWTGLVAGGLVPAPAIVASVGYRLAPDARHPAPLEDCIDAACRLRAMAGEIGADPDRLVVAGHSAGGQLAALMALRPDVAGPRGLPAEAIVACMPVSGMLDLRDFTAPGALPATLAREDQMADASPLEWTENARCPFFLAWGGLDYAPIIASNRGFASRLRTAGATFDAVTYPELDHYEIALAPADPGHDWCRRAARLIGALPA
jgi:acetyl esterase/lipase